MKNGNWVPIDKRFLHLLPTDRPFTTLEAMLSYSVNRDNGRMGTISGYAARWGWDRKRVRRFIRAAESGDDYTAMVVREHDGTPHGTPRGTGKGQAVRYVFNTLDSTEGQARDTPRDTPRDTIKDPDPKILKPKRDKGGKLTVPLRPSSFVDYLKTLEDFSQEKARAVAYYLDVYRARMRDDHPYLKPDQWARAMDGIFNGYDPDTGMESGPDDFEGAREIIDRHFQTDYADCDFNILHFVSGRVIYLRSREAQL